MWLHRSDPGLSGSLLEVSGFLEGCSRLHSLLQDSVICIQHLQHHITLVQKTAKLVPIIIVLINGCSDAPVTYLMCFGKDQPTEVAYEACQS